MGQLVDEYRLLMAEVYELAGLSRATSDQLAAASGSTAARWHVLSAISDGPATVPTIARRLGQSRQNVQRVAGDLLDAGAVTFEPNPAHERSPLVTLTAAGERVLEELFAASDRSRTELLERASVDVRRLRDARRTLRRLIDAYDER